MEPSGLILPEERLEAILLLGNPKEIECNELQCYAERSTKAHFRI